MRAKCDEIFATMARRYHFVWRDTRTDNPAVDNAAKGPWLTAKRPRGVVTLALFLHEVGHLANGDLVATCDEDEDEDEDTESAADKLRYEVKAWAFARDVFGEFGLEWSSGARRTAWQCLRTYGTRRQILAAMAVLKVAAF